MPNNRDSWWSRPCGGREVLAIALPLFISVDELRQRIGELDPAAETVVSCGIGLRGHVAARILKQHGFADVKNLAGGATVRNRIVAVVAASSSP